MHRLAALLQQRQRLLHALLAHVGGNAHARAFAKTAFEIALVQAHAPRQRADGKVIRRMGADEVDGVMHRAAMAALRPACRPFMRHVQPRPQYRQRQPLDLQALRQRGRLRGQQRLKPYGRTRDKA